MSNNFEEGEIVEPSDHKSSGINESKKIVSSG